MHVWVKSSDTDNILNVIWNLLLFTTLSIYQITHEFTLGFYWGSWYSIFSFMCMFCRSLFVLLFIFFRPLCCLFFFHIRILTIPLLSSNSYWTVIMSNYHIWKWKLCLNEEYTTNFPHTLLDPSKTRMCWMIVWLWSICWQFDRFIFVNKLWYLKIMKQVYCVQMESEYTIKYYDGYHKILSFRTWNA
jgi:hypothetical protein